VVELARMVGVAGSSEDEGECLGEGGGSEAREDPVAGED